MLQLALWSKDPNSFIFKELYLRLHDLNKYTDILKIYINKNYMFLYTYFKVIDTRNISQDVILNCFCHRSE